MTLKNGNLKDIIQITITAGMLLVAATLAFGNKADRDKVSACEMKITSLEVSNQYNDRDHAAMLATLKELGKKQEIIIEQLGDIRARIRKAEK